MPIIVIKNRKYEGKTALEATHEADAEVLSAVYDGQDIDNIMIQGSHASNIFSIRCALPGIRKDDCWPNEFHGSHCEFCDGFHTEFLYSHLYPALKFLERTRCCFRGYESILRFRLAIISARVSARLPNRTVFEDLLIYGAQLREVQRTLSFTEIGKEHLTTPKTTKMISQSSKERYEDVEEHYEYDSEKHGRSCSPAGATELLNSKVELL